MKPSTINRRDFLKVSATSMVGAAGIMLAPTLLTGTTSNKNQAEKATKIKKRTLGKTGIVLPIVSSGAVPIDNDDLVRSILTSGIIHIDTARSYHEGKNELILGKILKEFKRENFIISTKIKGPVNKETGYFTEEATTEYLLKQFDDSITALGIPYVDILYIHAVSNRETALHEPSMNALKILKEQGKTRFIGVSTHKNEPEVIDAVISSNFYDVVLTAYNFKQENVLNVKDAIKRAAEAGLGVVGMKTFAGNFWDKEKKYPIDRVAALKWTLQDKNLHTMLVNCKSYEYLHQAIECASNPKLSKKDKEKLLPPHSNTTGLYCPGCGKCEKECRAHLPIPDIMRAYMYMYGYKDIAKAQKTINSIYLPDESCKDCNTCLVQCKQHFNVAERINDIKRVKNIPPDFLA